MTEPRRRRPGGRGATGPAPARTRSRARRRRRAVRPQVVRAAPAAASRGRGAGPPVTRARPARARGRGRRRVGPVPADPDALLQHRRRRGGGDLAGGHPLLPGAVGRGARPGRAVPRADDAAVRDRGAADRPVPRPVQPRPPLGDRRDHGDPRVPVLGPGDGGRPPTRRGCSPPRWACLVASKAYGVTRAAAVPRLLPRDFTLVKANGRVSLAGDRRRALSAPMAGLPRCRARVVAALRVRACSSLATVCADPAARAGRLQRGRGRPGAARAASEQPGRRPARPDPDPARGRLRAARQLRTALAVGLPDHVHGVPAAREPDRRTGSPRSCSAWSSARPGSATPSASRSPRCCKQHQPGADRGARPGRRRGDRARRRALLRRAAADPARAHRRTRPVAGQVLARLDDPARRARAASRPARSRAATPPSSWRG